MARLNAQAPTTSPRSELVGHSDGPGELPGTLLSELEQALGRGTIKWDALAGAVGAKAARQACCRAAVDRRQSQRSRCRSPKRPRDPNQLGKLIVDLASLPAMDTARISWRFGRHSAARSTTPSSAALPSDSLQSLIQAIEPVIRDWKRRKKMRHQFVGLRQLHLLGSSMMTAAPRMLPNAAPEAVPVWRKRGCHPARFCARPCREARPQHPPT